MLEGSAPLVFTLILWWSTCHAAVSKPLWVKSNGSDTIDCGESLATACATLAHTVTKRASQSSQIYMYPGTYEHKSPTTFAKFDELNISGFSPSATAVRITCGGRKSTLSFEQISKIFLSNLSISDCHSTSGGSGGALDVSMNSNFNLQNVIVANSTSTGATGNGGCLAVSGLSSAIVRNSTFANCTTTGNGGAIFVDLHSTSNVMTSNFIGNGAQKAGGAMFFRTTAQARATHEPMDPPPILRSTLLLSRSNFTQNWANESGGAIASYTSNVNITDGCAFDGNVVTLKSDLSMEPGQSWTYGGGAISAYASVVNIVSSTKNTGSLFTHNRVQAGLTRVPRVPVGGGAVLVQGDAPVLVHGDGDVLVHGETEMPPPKKPANLTLRYAVFRSNTVSNDHPSTTTTPPKMFGYGGAVALMWATGVNFTHSDFYNNMVHGSGGAVALVDGPLRGDSLSGPSIVSEVKKPKRYPVPVDMDTVLMKGNRAISGIRQQSRVCSPRGGGLSVEMNAASIRLRRPHLVDNTVNNTLSSQREVYDQTSMGFGGGMFADFAGSLTITHGTMNGNSVSAEVSREGVGARVSASRVPASRKPTSRVPASRGGNGDTASEKDRGKSDGEKSDKSHDENMGKSDDNIWSMDGMCGGGLAVSEFVDLQIISTNFKGNMATGADATPAYGGALCLSPALLHDFDPAAPSPGSALISSTNFYNNLATVKDYDDDTGGSAVGGAVLVSHFALKTHAVLFDSVTFEGNRAYYGGDGGAITILGLRTSVTFTRSTFRNNAAWSRVVDTSYGGALCVRLAQVSLKDGCAFYHNYAGTDDPSEHSTAYGGMGGALASRGGSIKCHGCRFEHNIAFNTASDQYAGGGAVFLGPRPEPGVSSNAVTSVTTISPPIGASSDAVTSVTPPVRARSPPLKKEPSPPPEDGYHTHSFINCSFVNNSASTQVFGWGVGGAFTALWTSAEIRQCLFENNTVVTTSQTPARGGAISLYGMPPDKEPTSVIDRCVFNSNMATGTGDVGAEHHHLKGLCGNGGAVQVHLSHPRIIDSVFYNNSARCKTDDDDSLGGAIHILYGGAVLQRSSFNDNRVGRGGYGHIIYGEVLSAVRKNPPDATMVEIDESVFNGQAFADGPPPSAVTQVDCGRTYDLTFVLGVIDVRNSRFNKASLFVGNCILDAVSDTPPQRTKPNTNPNPSTPPQPQDNLGGAMGGRESKHTLGTNANARTTSAGTEGANNAVPLSLTLTNNTNHGMLLYSVSFNITLGSNTSWAHAVIHGTVINEDTIVPTLNLLPTAQAITITGTKEALWDEENDHYHHHHHHRGSNNRDMASKGELVMVNVSLTCQCITEEGLSVICGSLCPYDDIACWQDSDRVRAMDMQGNLVLSNQIFVDGCHVRLLEHATMIGSSSDQPDNCLNFPDENSASRLAGARSTTSHTTTTTTTTTTPLYGGVGEVKVQPALVYLVHGAWIHITKTATVEVLEKTQRYPGYDVYVAVCNASYSACSNVFSMNEMPPYVPLGLLNDGTLALSAPGAISVYGASYNQTDNGLLDLRINSKRACSWYFAHLVTQFGFMHLPSQASFLNVTLGPNVRVQLGYPYEVLRSNTPITGGGMGNHFVYSSDAWFNLSYHQHQMAKIIGSYQYYLDPKEVGCTRIDLQPTLNDTTPQCRYCLSKSQHGPDQCTWLANDLGCVAITSEKCQESSSVENLPWLRDGMETEADSSTNQCRTSCCAHNCWGNGVCNDDTGRCSCGMMYANGSDCRDTDFELIILITIIGLISLIAVAAALMASVISNRSRRLSLEKRGNVNPLDFEGFRNMLLEPDHDIHSPADVTRHKRLRQDLLLQSVSVNINEIQFHEKVGSGAFGVVYKGTWRKTDCAIKMVRRQPWRHRNDDGPEPTESDFSPKELDMIRSEALLMTQLKHPNIVLTMGIAFRNVNATGRSMLCIITEYAARGSLADVLSSPHHISRALRIRFALDAARGMLFLHTHSPPIVHRDLKSKNLLVDDRQTVKVCDFGNSCFCDPDAIATGQRSRHGHTLSALSYVDGSPRTFGSIRNIGRACAQHDGHDDASVSTETGSYATPHKTTPSGTPTPPRHDIESAALQNSPFTDISDDDDSKVSSPPHMMTTQKGTMQWTAPELMKMEARVAFHTLHDVLSVDVYSFGIVMWELLTRLPPFEAESAKSPWSVRDAVLAGRRPPIPEGCNRQYRALMQRCWSHNPKRRPLFGDVVRVILAIQKVIQHETAQARKASRDKNDSHTHTTATAAPGTNRNASAAAAASATADDDVVAWSSDGDPNHDPDPFSFSDTDATCDDEDTTNDPYATPPRKRPPGVLPTPERSRSEHRLPQVSLNDGQRKSVGRI